MRAAIFSILFACLISVTPAFASGGATITQPANGATVSGPVAISLIADPGVQWSNFYIDGNYYASTPPYTISWDSTRVANGTHTISATAYSANRSVLGKPSITVSVMNPVAALKLSSPIAGSQVAGAVTITANRPPGVVWENFYVDGGWIASSAPYSFNWNTNQVPDGAHTISVISYGNSGKLGADSLSVMITNGQVRPTRSVSATPTATLTVAPTKAPTVAPTAVPTIAPTTVPTAAPTPAPTGTPTASPTPVTTANYYVSPAGSDGNNGMTPGNPWRTLQHAVNTMPSGDTAIVAPGTYNERVSIVRDGITIQADPNAASMPVVVQGFDIAAGNVTVNGFEISFQNNATPDGYGIHIHDGAGAIVENNYLHDLCHEGIYLEPTVSNVQALNNRIVHAQMAGIMIDGSGALIQGNEVWGTYQHPAVLGGIFAGCTNDGGSSADADSMRFFGSNHVIRSNYAHDIEFDNGDTSKPNPSPHTDCFQTWGAAGESTSNILIDGNFCRWPTAQGEVSSIEALDGPVSNITFQNNIFQNMKQGVNATQDGGLAIGQLNFYNNTFDHLLAEAIIVDGGARNDNLENNIFYDIVGGDGFIAYAGGESFLDNVFYTRAGAPGGGRWWGGGATPPFQAVDPRFVNYGDATGVGANYHLCVAGQNGCSATSSIGHSGATIPSVPDDYDGNLRSGGYSIGAYQMLQ